MTNDELKEDYKMLIEAWINANNGDTKVLADSLVDYANKLNKPYVSNRREQLIADLHTIESYWNVEFNNKEETADYIIRKQGN